MIKFLVVSTPRSGTRYTSRVLTKAGLLTGHEMCFFYSNYWDKASFNLDTSREVYLPCGRLRPRLVGDSSWLAAAFLDEVPKDVVVVYQMRRPWDTLNSIAQQNRGHEKYMDPSQWAPKACGEEVYAEWPDKIEDRVTTFWRAWHDMIERKVARFDNVLRWRLGEICAEDIEELFSLIKGVPVDIEGALEHDTLENTRGWKEEIFTPDNTPLDIRRKWCEVN